MRSSFAVGMTLAFAIGPVGAPARAQSVFDPYRPDSAAYNSAVTPTLPNNFALPNAAREANQYENPRVFSGSRYNTFDRYINNESGDTESAAPRRRASGAGVPYYDAYRQYDREFQRDYVPNREADRSYYADVDRRNKLYQQAIRERDPVKRANLLREMHKPASRAKAAAAPTTDPKRPAASTPTTAPRRPAVDPNEALAAEALGLSADPARPAAASPLDLDPTRPATGLRGNGAGSINDRKRPTGIGGILERNREPVGLPDRRPPLPIEMAPAARSAPTSPPLRMAPAAPASTTLPVPPGAEAPR